MMSTLNRLVLEFTRVAIFFLSFSITESFTPTNESFTHHFVVVHFRCERCNCTAERCYEFHGTGKGDARWGEYKLRFELFGHCQRRVSFEEVEEIYGEMGVSKEPYCFINWNCRHWAECFYKTLTHLPE